MKEATFMRNHFRLHTFLYKIMFLLGWGHLGFKEFYLTNLNLQIRIALSQAI